jgi:dTDP-4-dehydrorhamnose reductase
MTNPKKILITGANGLLGQKATEIFRNESSHELILTDLHDNAFESKGFDYFPMDITKKEEVKDAVKKYLPEGVEDPGDR